MRVVFVKLSDQRHTVRVERSDGSSESVELELGLAAGVWGSVARGGSLSGSGLDGADMALAETLSGPMQTMMRTEASAIEIHEVLARMAPGAVSLDLAARLHARVRSLAGHWAATPYGAEMVLDWPEGPDVRR